MNRSAEMPRPVAGTQGANRVLIGSAVLAALAAVWVVFSYGYLEDDAYIHLVFARSVASGQGFAFDGVPTNGDTAPLWVLLLNVLHALGLDWIAAAKTACGLGVMVTVLGIQKLIAALPTVAGQRERLLVATLAVTVLNPYFVRWSFSGMEVGLALGISLWIVWAAFIAKPAWGALLCGAALLGAAPLLRPEFLLLGAVAGPVFLWKAWQLARPDPTALRLARALAVLSLMVIPLGVWMGYAQHAFGTIIPNTNVAKRGGSLSELTPRLISVYLAGFPVTIALLPVLATRWRAVGRAPLAIWVLLVWPALCVAFYLADHTLVQTRYCLLSMPCVSIAVLWLLDASARPPWFRAGAVAMIAISLISTVLATAPLVANKARGVTAYSELSDYIRAQVPAGEPVAVYAIGQVDFDSGHPVIDVGGITKPGVIPYLGNPAATVRWAKEQGAHYLVGHAGIPEPGAIQLFVTSVPYLGWTFSGSQRRASEPLVLYKLR